ncbi:MAG: response regulator, partial [Candidatus Zixiibacteriota bacterium]
GCSGVVFLLNRARRQFVLATASGLAKEEIAQLENYPYGRNPASQAVELGDPLLGGSFDFVGRDGGPVRSRFNSSLILPLVSTSEKIGVMILLAEEKRVFGRTEIRYLGPVAEWLGEKIRGARLDRELSLLRTQLDRQASDHASFSARVGSAVRALRSTDAVGGLCRGLVGLADSESVHLVALRHGELTVHGGSEPLTDLSENYRTALINALDRPKPLIINQEITTESGHSEISHSSLVIPASGEDSSGALLLRKSLTAFKIDDSELKALDTFGLLARVALRQRQSHRLDITRRKGFEAVLGLLQADIAASSFSDDTGLFQRQIMEAMPGNARALTFRLGDDGWLGVSDTYRVPFDLVAGIRIAPGDGELGRAPTSHEPSFIFGQDGVNDLMKGHESQTRERLQRMIEDVGLPVFMAICPARSLSKAYGMVLVMLYDMEEKQRSEWERLLTLATGLYSLRLSLASSTARSAASADPSTGSVPGALINHLNNHLSAIVGSAELVNRQNDLPRTIRGPLESIVSEAERAAGRLRKVRPKRAPNDEPDESGTSGTSLVSSIRSVLGRFHISGDLYMIGGRAREVDVDLGNVPPLVCSTQIVRALFEGVLDRFGSVFQNDDVLSVVTYHQDGANYLDLSRHRKNFPPVQRVVGFGKYQPAGQALRDRPSDVFLRHVANIECHYAVDRESPAPAYMSFRFPVQRAGPQAVASGKTPVVRMLVIDDHDVILDLVASMGQSMGYQVDTARRGHDGIRMAAVSTYDLVLTDLAMPEISGLEVARRIHFQDPEVPIILVTGWDANIESDKLSAHGIREILYKPFRIEQLTDLVQALALRRS